MVIHTKIASKKECEAADYVICLLKENDPGYFDDNVEGVCCMCERPVIFRPYAPKNPPKICMECLTEKLSEG